ncbi:MAG: ABC transporter permease, partial [Actinobacteria bacterium]|nr:ABC transporter permease [Actinomycetota bacterium]
YATPILYPIEAVLARYETVAKIQLMNPLAAIIQESRHLLTGAPSPAAVLGSTALLAVPLALLVLIIWLGFRVFDRMAPLAAEEL